MLGLSLSTLIVKGLDSDHKSANGYVRTVEWVVLDKTQMDYWSSVKDS